MDKSAIIGRFELLLEILVDQADKSLENVDNTITSLI